nr:SIMPL domain-containing protein [Paenibacillus caui]
MNVWTKRLGAVAIAGSLIMGGTAVSGLLNQSVPAYAADSDSTVQNTISVTGNGKISVKPDLAYLSLGVETRAATAKEAQSRNAAALQKLNTLLKDTWKIDAADIKTSQFYVQPNYTYNDKEGQKVNGYIAHHTLQVKYRQLDKIGQLLDAASNAGANNIENVTFTVENPDQYQEQVIAKAMTNAGVKANAIAKSANRQLGIVLNVVQSDNNNIPLFQQNQAYAKMSAEADSASTSVEPGEITVETTLSVQYAMK